MFGTGKRCTKGYHRKGTKPVNGENNDTRRDVRDTRRENGDTRREDGDTRRMESNTRREMNRTNDRYDEVSQNLCKDELKSFFGEILRGEMYKIERKIINLEEQMRDRQNPPRTNQETEVLNKIRSILTL